MDPGEPHVWPEAARYTLVRLGGTSEGAPGGPPRHIGGTSGAPREHLGVALGVPRGHLGRCLGQEIVGRAIRTNPGTHLGPICDAGSWR